MANAGVPQGASITVIGVGIIGVASAYQLGREGYEVTSYDPEPPGEAGPSRANAGHARTRLAPRQWRFGDARTPSGTRRVCCNEASRDLKL